MKNKKVLNIVVIVVLLAVGLPLLLVGNYGQGIYNETGDMLGTKRPNTIDFIKDPDSITEVAYGQDPQALTKYLVKTLGLPEDRVNAAVSARATLDEMAAKSKNADAFKAYLADTQGLSDEEAQDLIRDREAAQPIREEMQKAEVMAALKIDEAAYEALLSDQLMLDLFKEGLPSLQGSGFAAFSYRNAVMLVFSGIILLVLVGTYILFLLMDRSAKSTGKAKTLSRGQEKIKNSLLNYALYIILGTILVTVSIMRPNFLDISNILNILKQASTKGILALGCAGLIVLGGTDLSIGRVLGFSAAVTASLVQSVEYASRMFPQMTSPLPLLLPLLASIAVAVIFALINGFGVAKLHLHAFIVTLGTQLIAQGLTCIYIESQPSGTAQALSTFDRGFLDAAAGNLVIGGAKIPLVVLYFIALAVIMWIVWNKTKLGKNMFAVGGNKEAAQVSGVNVARTIMLVYLISGVLYGISAFLETARITSVGANTGLNYELDAISACVVGGVSFSGGVGTIQGVFIGAIILQAINYSLQFLGVNPYLQYIIRGLIIVLAVSIDVRKTLVRK